MKFYYFLSFLLIGCFTSQPEPKLASSSTKGNAVSSSSDENRVVGFSSSFKRASSNENGQLISSTEIISSSISSDPSMSLSSQYHSRYSSELESISSQHFTNENIDNGSLKEQIIGAWKVSNSTSCNNHFYRHMGIDSLRIYSDGTFWENARHRNVTFNIETMSGDTSYHNQWISQKGYWELEDKYLIMTYKNRTQEYDTTLVPRNSHNINSNERVYRVNIHSNQLTLTNGDYFRKYDDLYIRKIPDTYGYSPNLNNFYSLVIFNTLTDEWVESSYKNGNSRMESFTYCPVVTLFSECDHSYYSDTSYIENNTLFILKDSVYDLSYCVEKDNSINASILPPPVDTSLFETSDETCNDGIDNDLDNKIDCEDKDCTYTRACNLKDEFHQRSGHDHMFWVLNAEEQMRGNYDEFIGLPDNHTRREELIKNYSQHLAANHTVKNVIKAELMIDKNHFDQIHYQNILNYIDTSMVRYDSLYLEMLKNP
ncbi:MAG: hypothetical protein OCD01_17245 [Fibrobacterales bacterium]